MRLVVFLSLFLFFVVVLAGSYGMISSTRSHTARSTCDAPCTVKFPQGTQEDEFRIDYAKGKLQVWRSASEIRNLSAADFDPHALGMRGIDDVAISQDARGNVVLVQGLHRGKPIVTLFDAELVD